MIQADDPNNAGALFETYHARIRRYITRIVRDSAEADDLTQETFMRAHRHQQALRDPLAVRGWLYRIATHVCLDSLRKRGQARGRELAEQATPDAAGTPGHSSAYDMLERAETSACVQRCLDYLPDSHRAVILLYEGHGLSVREIADLLGTTPGAVKIRLHRARRRLQDVMEVGCTVSRGANGLPCCERKA
jgi:RNA polymerase sigma-70 factor (ECF subfamily)